MTRGKQQINSSSLLACERERQRRWRYVRACLAGWKVCEDVQTRSVFLIPLPASRLPLGGRRNKDGSAVREKAICPQWAVFIINRLACVVWPSSTSRVSGVKAEPSVADEQIRLETQPSAQPAREQNEVRRQKTDGSGETDSLSTDLKCFGNVFCSEAGLDFYPQAKVGLTVMSKYK